MKVVLPFPPHLLSQIIGCDFCQNDVPRSVKASTVGKSKTSAVGWCCCTQPACLTMLNEARKNWIYEKTVLENDLLRTVFVVKRTSGNLEPGWKIKDHGFRVPEKIEDVYVTLYKDRKGKTVLLSDLRRWNAQAAT